MIEQQVMNYLLWLKERGQGYFVANELAGQHATMPTQEADVLPPIKVLFVSLQELNSPEHEMVSRIATALSLKADDFVIAFAEEAKAIAAVQELCSLVIMGDDAEGLVVIKEGQIGLRIPHPGAMLVEPQLKVSAWNSLQKLKAAL